MTLGVTAEQELRDSVRRFLADRAPLSRVRELMETEDGIDRAVWEQAGAQLGLLGLAIPEEYGGGGFTLRRAGDRARGARRRAVRRPVPGQRACSPPRRCSPAPTRAPGTTCCPAIASGEIIATLAFTEDDGSWDPGTVRLAAAKAGDDWRLDGHKSFVLDGGAAGLILVAGRRRRRAVAVRGGSWRAGPRPDRRCRRWTRPASWPGWSSTACPAG